MEYFNVVALFALVYYSSVRIHNLVVVSRGGREKGVTVDVLLALSAAAFYWSL